MALQQTVLGYLVIEMPGLTYVKISTTEFVFKGWCRFFPKKNNKVKIIALEC